MSLTPTLVIDAGFDAVAKVNAQLSCFALQLFIQLGLSAHSLGKEIAEVEKNDVTFNRFKLNCVLMLGEIGKFVGHVLGQESSAFLFTVIFFITAAFLDPLKSFEYATLSTFYPFTSGSLSTPSDNPLGG